jgi:CHASE1-domain containing sensor protein
VTKPLIVVVSLGLTGLTFFVAPMLVNWGAEHTAAARMMAIAGPGISLAVLAVVISRQIQKHARKRSRK